MCKKTQKNEANRMNCVCRDGCQKILIVNKSASKEYNFELLIKSPTSAMNIIVDVRDLLKELICR